MRAARALRRLGPHPLLVVKYVAHHAATQYRQRRLRHGYSRRVANAPETGRLRTLAIPLASAEGLPAELRPAAESIRGEAELVLDNRFDVLGSGPVDLGDEIDWSCDFKSGFRWPLAFYQDVVVTRLTDDSDAKVPWELSRGHHLLTLARAAVLFEDDRYVDRLESQFDSWLKANPVGYGINWASPMEVALRAVNWLWAIATVEGWRPLDEAVKARVTRSLQAHGRHIAANLEGTPYLRSNHYLANVLGLLVLGAFLEDDPEAPKWFSFAQRELGREIRTQIHDDGVGFEASLPYHGLAFEMLLIAKIVADQAGAQLSDDFEERLLRMFEASRALRHPSGRLPQFGDNDSGRVLPGSRERKPTLDHLLWLAAAVLECDRPLGGEPHPEVAWTIGLPGWQRLLDARAAGPPTRASFPVAGLYALRSRHAQVFVRCGDVGQNGNGGHAHNDLLSFELSCSEPLVIDSGTYAYTSDPLARNDFRSTAAHNTIRIGNAEINPIVADELFRLRQFAHPIVEVWEELADRVRLVARHDGYRRLRPAVSHRRTFLLERASGRLEIQDELLGRGNQTAAAFLHLAPDLQVKRSRANEFQLAGRSDAVTLTFRGTVELELTQGWVSDCFGVRVRAPLLVARASGALPMSFGCEFRVADAPGNEAARASGVPRERETAP